MALAVPERVERAIGRLSAASFRRPFLALFLVAVTVLASVIAARGLALSTDLTRLLPSSYRSVRDVENVTARFGGVGYVAVVAEGAEPERLRAFADAVVPELEKLGTVRYVEKGRPEQFFRDHALYYFDEHDLESLRDRLAKRRDWEVKRAADWSLDDESESEPAPPVEVSDLEEKYRERLGIDRQPRRSSAYYIDESARRLVVLVRPSKLASDLQFARDVVADVDRVLRSVKDGAGDKGRWDDVKVELAGRYKKRVDLQDTLSRDLRITSIVSLVLILGYVALHFRNPVAVGLLFVPLMVALAWTYGFARVTIGSLNILTAFIGAILLGTGVDEGIHLLGRFEEEREEDASNAEAAVAAAFGEAGRASAAAVLTNVGAFLCLTIADFKAFREFGILAASGMFFMLVSYVVVLPALLGAWLRIRGEVAKPKPPPMLPFTRGLVRRAPWILHASIAAGILFSIWALPRLRFNYDFAAIDSVDLPSYRLDKEVNRLLGHSQTPLLVLADDADDARVASQAIRDRKRALGSSSTVDRVLGLVDLVPLNQRAKAPIISEIGEIVARIDENKLDEAKRRQLLDLRSAAKAAPFARDDLPGEVRRQFELRDGKLADFVLVYPAVSMSDGREAQRLARELRGITLDGGRTIEAAGEPMVLADILDSVTRELPRMTLLAGIQQVLLLTLLLGGLRAAALTLVPAFVTVPIAAAVLGALRIDLDYLNVILLPTLLGMGEDGGAHLVTRVRSGEPVASALGHTGFAAFGASLTAIFGFGVLGLAAHPGLRTFGVVAVIGFAANLFVCVVFLPALLATLQSFGEKIAARRARRDEPSGTRSDEIRNMKAGRREDQRRVG